MIEAIDHIVIAVADLDAATEDYAALLGRTPSWRGRHPEYGTRNTLFRLDNAYVELLAAESPAPAALASMVAEAVGKRQEQVFALALRVAALDAAVRTLRGRGVRVSDPVCGEGTNERGRRRTWRNAWLDPNACLGLRLFVIEHTSPADALPPAGRSANEASVCRGVDHVVIVSGDLAASLRFWEEVFGVAPRWQLEFAQRHTRNAGLMVADIMVECLMRTDREARSNADRLWGLAYRVRDCAHAVARLREAGIPVDDPRPGLAPETQVTTVRWSRTPTLLLSPGC